MQVTEYYGESLVMPQLDPLIFVNNGHIDRGYSKYADTECGVYWAVEPKYLPS